MQAMSPWLESRWSKADADSGSSLAGEQVQQRPYSQWQAQYE